MSYTRLQNLREQIYGYSDSQRNTRANILAAMLIHKWQQEASKRLGSTLDAYRAAISKEEVTADKIVVSLPENAPDHVAFIARMVEFGYGARGIGSYGGPYDMRTAGQNLLTTIKKTSKTAFGMQKVVAFRMNKSQASSRVSSGDIDKAFRQQAAGGKPIASVRLSSGKTSWGTILSPSLSQKIKPHHATTGAAGMVFSANKNSNSKGQSGTEYTIFRTVSRKRTPGSPSWVSKGVEPYDIARRHVVPQLPEILKEAGVL